MTGIKCSGKNPCRWWVILRVGTTVSWMNTWHGVQTRNNATCFKTVQAAIILVLGECHLFKDLRIEICRYVTDVLAASRNVPIIDWNIGCNKMYCTIYQYYYISIEKLTNIFLKSMAQYIKYEWCVKFPIYWWIETIDLWIYTST